MTKRLAIYTEQGIGDMVQFLRYVPLAAKRVEAVYFEVQRAWRPLLDFWQKPDNVILFSTEDPVPEVDAAVALLSLPRILKLYDPKDAPKPPYLSVPPALKLGGGVAVTWYGNPNHKNDRRRSIPLDQLAPVIQSRPDLKFWTCSPEDKATEDIKRTGLPIEQRKGTLKEAVAWLAGADLLLSVDTSHVHIAGALGVPTWCLLPLAPDWRWMLKGASTPWYPSVELIRQHAGEQGWSQVVRTVTGRMEAFERPL